MRNCLSSFLIDCHQRRKVKIIVWHWQDRPHTSLDLEINWNRNRTRTEPSNQNSFRRSTREYWMICRGARLSRRRMIWLLPHPLLSRQQVVSLSVLMCRRPSLLTGEGGRGWSQLIAGEKAWSSYTVAIHYSLIVTVFRWTLKFNLVSRFYQTSV